MSDSPRYFVIDRTRSKTDAHSLILEQDTSHLNEDYKVLMNNTVNNLREARDSALKDIQDLREGMKVMLVVKIC